MRKADLSRCARRAGKTKAVWLRVIRDMGYTHKEALALWDSIVSDEDAWEKAKAPLSEGQGRLIKGV